MNITFEVDLTFLWFCPISDFSLARSWREGETREKSRRREGPSQFIRSHQGRSRRFYSLNAKIESNNHCWRRGVWKRRGGGCAEIRLKPLSLKGTETGWMYSKFRMKITLIHLVNGEIVKDRDSLVDCWCQKFFWN